MIEVKLNDDLYFNIIGINETGKMIIDSVNDKYFESVLDDLNNKRCYHYLYPSWDYEIRPLGNFHINKYFINNISEINITKNNYFTIIVYDNNDYELANKISKKLDISPFLNIGICINGNKNIDNLKVIETSFEEAKDVIINLILHLLPIRGSITTEDVYKDFFETGYKYKAFNLIAKSILNEQKELENKIDNIKDNMIDASALVGTNHHWPLMDQAKIFFTIRSRFSDDYKGFYGLTDSYMDDEIVTIIYKIKE